MRVVIVLGFEGVLLVRNAFEQSKTSNYCIHTRITDLSKFYSLLWNLESRDPLSLLENRFFVPATQGLPLRITFGSMKLKVRIFECPCPCWRFFCLHLLVSVSLCCVSEAHLRCNWQLFFGCFYCTRNDESLAAVLLLHLRRLSAVFSHKLIIFCLFEVNSEKLNFS